MNIEATMPIPSVTAKPLTGPVPNWKSTSAVSSVVRLESTIAERALPKPSDTAARGARPLSSSSRIRSKIRMFASTAIPMESTIPAIPGRVSVAPSPERPPSTNSTYAESAVTASTPATR